MRIGIIGAGFIGKAVAERARGAGHEALLSNSRGPQSLMNLAAELEAKAGTVEDAADFGEVVVLAIPFFKLAELPPELLAGKLVIDVNNYYPDRDGRIAGLDAFETTTSEIVARHFPEARVVKAFNAILAADLAAGGKPVASGWPRALPIAGEDATAKAVVAGLHLDFHFDWLDTGALAGSWRFERAKPAYCLPLDRQELAEALSAAERTVELAHGSWRK